MGSLKKPLATAELLPWIPPGKGDAGGTAGKKKSFNRNVYKKNEGAYYDAFGSSIASSTVFQQAAKKPVSLNTSFYSPKKNSRKLTLGKWCIDIVLPQLGKKNIARLF